MILAAAGILPARGERFPDISGPGTDRPRRSTRDFYMRRNLAVIVLRHDSESNAAAMPAVRKLHELVRQEGGEILIVAPVEAVVNDIPSIVDDGLIAVRLGVTDQAAPAIFILDRYGTIFATNAADGETPDLTVSEIPRWLEFVACRCS